MLVNADNNPLGVATGTDFTQRIGRKINVCSVQVRGFWRMSAPTTTANGIGLRIMLVEDAQSNGAAPAIGDILSQGAEPSSFNNLNNRERFKIHKDLFKWLPPFNTTAATQNTQNWGVVNWYKKVWIPVVFEGTAATIGSIASGALFLVVMADYGGNDMFFRASVRVRFYDA